MAIFISRMQRVIFAFVDAPDLYQKNKIFNWKNVDFGSIKILRMSQR